MASGAELSADHPRRSPNVRTSRGRCPKALFGGVGMILLAGCVTRPPSRREWPIAHDGAETSLVYGRRGASHADFAVVCDIGAGIADLVYYVGAATGVTEGARTE